ncbi:pikachurin-like [Mytilus edulis]|uniref:pikachurin-like n=1 Tax=Mytilus edulis TaxID=6550 RepID=UPI0039EEEAAB
MAKIFEGTLIFVCFITLFTFLECEIHEAFFSGDCKKATTFCKHECIDIDKGFICKCHSGYQLQKDGQSCQRISGYQFIGSNGISVDTHHLSSVQSIPSSQQQNLVHSEANNQISYNKLTLKNENHNVILGNKVDTFSPVQDHVELGATGHLAPLAIMRPPTCDEIICQNGGHCVARGPAAKCDCLLGFGGRYCDKNVPVKYPKFSGDGYMAFPVLTDGYKQFEVKLNIRPDRSNGLILFSGEKKNAESDFFSIALMDGFVEFRYDCGTGMAVIKSKDRVDIGDWNMVTVKRVGNEGSLKLNDHDMIQGLSQGAYSRLTLRLKLYLGGYIDMHSIAERVGVTQSFVGCIQSMNINNEQYDMRQVDFFGQAELGLNVGECSSEECLGVTCQNGGLCTATSADKHVCLCLLGWTGELCQQRIEIHVPYFGGHSFVRHPGLERSSLSFTEIEMVFKPISWEGLILYNGYTNDRKGDFISLAMREGHLEFKFDLGTGPGVLRSIQHVTLNEWHHVKVTRTGLQGIMEIDNQLRVEGNAEGGFTQLTLLQDLYIGGHENFDQISKLANLTSSYTGCIQKMIINGRPLEVVSDAREGINIDNCDHPCVDQPCLNAGECQPDKGEYNCYCPLGYHGSDCEDIIEEKIDAAHFSGHSYLKYSEKDIIERVNGNKIDVQMKIKPETKDGLLFWSGKHYPLTSSSDFFALGFTNGALILRYNLGGGEVKITYNSTNLFDGKWHDIRVQRDKTDSFIMVDNSQVVEGSSPGRYTILNTNQRLFIGGMPEVSQNSLNKFTSGFHGCIKDLMLAEDYLFNLVDHAESGRNVHSCQTL